MMNTNLRKNSDVAVCGQTVNLVDYLNKTIYLFLKRLLDIFLSLVGIILLIPILIIIRISMWLSKDFGSLFYSQIRVGKNRTPFRMYKIRSMCEDADDQFTDLLSKNEIEGAMFKIKDDPRVTRIGSFIRKTSIDELPQFFNVLCGDMSLVGPRPPLEREIVDYTERDFRRLEVRPGCAGLWQISGRNELSFKEMVELDLLYIRNRSLLLDIVIILKTVGVMVKPNGAY